MTYQTIRAFSVFLYVTFIVTYEMCPKYKCDSNLKIETCGKISKVKDIHTNEIYNEYSLFPCVNHKQRCKISQISENSDALCKEETPIVTTTRQVENRSKKY